MTTLKLVDIYRFTTKAFVGSPLNKFTNILVKVRTFGINTMQNINHIPTQRVALCLTDVNMSARLAPIFGLPVDSMHSHILLLRQTLFVLVPLTKHPHLSSAMNASF